MGIQRQKNDRLDSEQPALYAYRYLDNARQYVSRSKELKALHLLYSLRGRLIKNKASLSQAATEMRSVIRRDPTANEMTLQEIQRLQKRIKDVEGRMIACIKQDSELYANYLVLTGITGIALINASVMLVYTVHFMRLDSARQYACHTGMAPFGKKLQNTQKCHAKG